MKCPECGMEINPTVKSCPNCAYPLDGSTTGQEGPSAHTATADENDFGAKIGSALVHTLYRLIIYFPFILPFHLWKKAVIRMDNQRNNHLLDADTIVHEVPFFVWLKRFLFDFVFDGLTILSWFWGIVSFIVELIRIINLDLVDVFWFLPLQSMYCWYSLPLVLVITKDIVTWTVILPMRWLLSFYRRPAKSYDVTHSGNIARGENH